MHSKPIADYEEAKNLGLHVNLDVPPDLFQLMSLYAQPIKQQPSVGDIPYPRSKGAPRGMEG